MAEPSQARGGARDLDLALAAARLAREKLARDVKLLRVGDRLGICEFFLLATVNNRRQARAVRDAIRVGLKEEGFGVPLGASEDPDGRWSLYDYGVLVLHLFDDEGREFFDLDAMWSDAAVIPLTDAEPSDADADADAEVPPARPGKKRRGA